MSINHEVRITKLEQRVADLEARLSDDLTVARRGRLGWGVRSNGEWVGTEPLSKGDAEKLCEELSGAGLNV